MKSKRIAECPPPDGGWGWLICLACFVGNFTLGGIKRSFGLALPLLKHDFQVTTSSISLVASIIEGMYYVAGPLASIVANRVGLRLTSIIGSVITSVALFCSTYSTSVNILILSYSVLGGIGLGFIYLPASVACNYYFEKRRGFATGISKCGYSIGGIAFPPIANVVLTFYGWKAMFYMFSCVSLVNCGCACLLKPLQNVESSVEPSIQEEDKESLLDSNDAKDNASRDLNHEHCIVCRKPRKDVHKCEFTLSVKVNINKNTIKRKITL